AHVFRLARRSRVTTVLNPAPMRPDFNPSILRTTDVLIPNESEFAALSKVLSGRAARVDLGTSTLRAREARNLHRMCRAFGVPTVIVTLGRRGCLVSLADGTHTVIPGHTGLKV